MKRTLGFYKFGSHVMGTQTETSDIDQGLLEYDGFQTIFSLDLSKQSHAKNSHSKSGINDIEIMQLANLVRQAYKPSPNFHAKLSTLHSVIIDVEYLQRLVDIFFHWKPYLYRSLGFCNNCDSTTRKGVIHKWYTAELAITQYEVMTYMIPPTFWQNSDVLLEDFPGVNLPVESANRLANLSVAKLEMLAENSNTVDIHKESRQKYLMSFLLDTVIRLEQEV